MKKQLGKKAHVQEGTMTAFACDCISVCQSLTKMKLFCEKIWWNEK